jgi:diadenylate cyclase
MPARYRFLNVEMRDALAKVAPGTPLRTGVERIVRSKAGALLVVNDGPEVLAICSGGFLVDAPFSPQRLSELAKMDGAIILSANCETGTRHRTAERVARSLNVPVISASEEMGVINLYAGGLKQQLQDISRLLDRANQALQTLERYKVRLEDALLNLTSAELEDAASLRDVAAVVQRGEMVNRIAEEIETMIIELGVDARLLRLQLDEIYGDIDNELELVIGDYLPAGRTAADTLSEMATLSDDDVLDLRTAAATLHRDGDPHDLDQDVAPKGLRLLNRVHRLSDDSATRIADHFGGLARLQRATVADLVAVEGVDDLTAASIKETLQRVTESAILDQYS